MKSQKAKEAIERYRRTFSAPYQVDETAEYCRLFKEIAEIAEKEAEERMREKAHKIVKEMMEGVFQGNMPQNIADEFIQKLNEK